MEDKLILRDGTEIALEAGASLGSLSITVASLEALGAIWDSLTPENLKAVQVKTGEGLTVGEYTDMVLCAPAWREVDKAPGGGVTAMFGIRGKTAVELMEERLAKVEEGQQVQDGAIEDIAAAASALAEQTEGGVA